MSEEVINNVVIEKNPTKKAKKKKSKARKIFEWVFFSIFIGIGGFILVANINGEIHKSENYNQSIRFGVGSFIVITDSMVPDIPVDAAIITYQEDIESFTKRFDNGEIVDLTFADVSMSFSYTPKLEEFQPINGGHRSKALDRVMTHRLREYEVREEYAFGEGRYVFVTSGINEGALAYDKGEYQYFTENEYLGVVKVTNLALGKIFRFIVSAWGLLILLLVPAIYLIVVSSIDIFKAMKASEEQENAETPKGGALASVKGEDRERLKKELLEEMRRKRMEKENENKD